MTRLTDSRFWALASIAFIALRMFGWSAPAGCVGKQV